MTLNLLSGLIFIKMQTIKPSQKQGEKTPIHKEIKNPKTAMSP
jgi:hypothetical protein